jgi:hypothetical protein
MPPRSRVRLSILLLIVSGLSIVPCAGAQAAVRLPDGRVVAEVDFERHLMGLFGRLGCNSGACHGSFQGKNGFRLSLFGYDPTKDYYALTREGLGRRVNPVEPDRSLLLLKTTGQTEHGGGRRFARDSWQYRLFRQWIAAGAPWRSGSGDVDALLVDPVDHALIQPQATATVRVRARFTDGSEEDVTPFCDFRVQDDAVAEVSPLGEIRALRPGDTALVASYRGNVRAIRLLVPISSAPDFRYPPVPEAGFIDREVFAKLKQLGVVPSGLSSDSEFLRRVTIDTIGCLPSPEEVRAFLADQSPGKRAKKIDELLAHRLHAALWATKFSDITGNNTDLLSGKGGPVSGNKFSQMWYDWFRKRLAENVPYDEIVRGVLCATSRDGQTPENWVREVKRIEQAAQAGFQTPYAERASLDLYWRLGRAPTLESWGERTAVAFLGIRLECAQCHKHPFDRWTQVDYRAYANIFGRVAVGLSPAAKSAVEAGYSASTPKGQTAKAPPIAEVFIADKYRGLPHPDADASRPALKTKGLAAQRAPSPLPAKCLGGPPIPVERGRDARLALFEWLRSPDNPYFARSFANRVWGHYFGVGLVDPVDNFSLANPPTNETLLDALAKDFVGHSYDIRHLERTILNSRVYQLSSDVNETNELDRNNYSHSYLRLLMAEVAVDVLNCALGVTETFKGDAPPGSRAIEVGASRLQTSGLAYAFRVFGRSQRTSACDCDRSTEPALPQTLYLMADPAILQKLRDSASSSQKPKGDKNGPGASVPPAGRLGQLLGSAMTDEQVLEELFLATHTRLPTEAEKKRFEVYRDIVRKQPAEANQGWGTRNKGSSAQPVREARKALFIDALWALINTREFILNH